MRSRARVDAVRAGDSYALVLSLLLAALFLGIAAPDEVLGRLIKDVIIAMTVVVAYWTATGQPQTSIGPRVVIPIAALAFVGIAIAERDEATAPGALFAVALTAFIGYVIARDLTGRRDVDVQTVCGALSLYVLTGFLFASLFTFVAVVDPTPLFTRGDDATIGERLYFSFITLTTTGYGDLSPTTGFARALSVLEVVVGSLYLVTVVAVLATRVTKQDLLDPDRVPGGGTDRSRRR